MRFLLAAAGLLFAPTLVTAQVPTDVQRCRAVTDSLQRLACYDTIAGPALVASGATHTERWTWSTSRSIEPR